MEMLFVVMVIAAGMAAAVLGVLVEPDDRRLATYGGFFGGFIAGMISGGDLVVNLLVGGLLAASFRGYAVYNDWYADGNELAFLVSTCVLACLPPAYLFMIPVEVAGTSRRRAAEQRLRAERLWRDEFTAIGATDPVAFIPSHPDAVMPRAVREQIDRQASGELAPDIHDGARRAADAARERSRVRREYLDSRKYVRRPRP